MARVGPNRRAVADRLHSAMIRLLRSLRASDVEMGLSPARASALSVLVFGGPRSPSALAEAEQVARPTITKLLGGMRRDGLVRLEPHAEDGRSMLVHATARGRDLLERGRRRRIDALVRLLSGLDPRELSALDGASAILTRLAGAPRSGARPRAARKR